MQTKETKALTGDEKVVDVISEDLGEAEDFREIFGDLTVDDVESLQHSVFHALCDTPVRAQPSDFSAIGSVHGALICASVQRVIDFFDEKVGEYGVAVSDDDPLVNAAMVHGIAQGLQNLSDMSQEQLDDGFALFTTLITTAREAAAAAIHRYDDFLDDLE